MATERFRRFPAKRCAVCPKWLTKDQIRRGGVCCCQACAGVRHHTVPIAKRRAWAQQGNDKRAVLRLRALLKAIAEDLGPWFEGLSMDEKKAVAKVVVKHRRISYHNGYSARYANERRRRRPAA